MRKIFVSVVTLGSVLFSAGFGQALAAEALAQADAKSGVVTSAQGSPGNGASPAGAVELDHPGMIDRMMYKLSLTKEQKQKIHAIRDAKRQKASALHGEQKEKLGALQTALRSGSDDDVRKAFEALQLSNQKLSALHLEGVLETRVLLTPEQRETFSGMTLHVLGGHKRGRHGGK